MSGADHTGDVGQKLTALFAAIDARYAVADDFRVELGVWIWPGETVPLTYWAKLKRIDIHDTASPQTLIDLSDCSPPTLEEAVDLLLAEWERLTA